MRLFGRTGGYYLFWTGFIYFVLGMLNIFWLHFVPVEILQATWIAVLIVPLVVPPVARYFNMKTLWEM